MCLLCGLVIWFRAIGDIFMLWEMCHFCWLRFTSAPTRTSTNLFYFIRCKHRTIAQGKNYRVYGFKYYTNYTIKNMNWGLLWLGGRPQSITCSKVKHQLDRLGRPTRFLFFLMKNPRSTFTRSSINSNLSEKILMVIVADA